MTEATFGSVKGKLEVIAPYLRHSHDAKVITIFQNTSRYGRKKSNNDERTADFHNGSVKINLRKYKRP